MSRKRFTERMVIETLHFCGIDVLCYRCKTTLQPGEKIEREHIEEIALGGLDDPVNCAYSHKACHAIVTNGTKATSAGSSKHRIAKTIRLAQGKRPSRHPMQKGRGFDKTLTRHMNGRTERRTP